MVDRFWPWPDNWNRSDVAEPRWRRLLKKRHITEYAAARLPFRYYGYKEQAQLVNKAGFSIVKVRNTYEEDSPYCEEKAGLVMVVENHQIR